MPLAPHHGAWIATLAALPWIVIPLVTILRMSHSRTLDDESATPPTDAPLVSIIIPARNEARNIGECVRSALAATYPALEILVVDDHSTDETRAIATALADTDPRVRVIANPDLPAGWFGKQWACQTGAMHAHGDILIFVDADTRLAPDLVTRSVNGMQRTGADLYTVAGRQDMHTFWERLIQPQVFMILASRYGGTESVNRSRHAWDKIANGQYLMLRHSTYDQMDGHALVRHYVAEDLMLAQTWFAAGRTTVLVLGWNQLTTRMYTSLRELISGWRKNVYAGGIDAVPMGAVGRALFPVLLPLPALMQLAPVVALLLALFGIGGAALLAWSVVATVATLALWALVYRVDRQNPLYALCFPIGAAVLLYILVSATARGSAVEWKGRAYRSGTAASA